MTVAENLIFIGDTLIGLDTSLDESKEPENRMRQAALTTGYCLIGDQLDTLTAIAEVLRHSVKTLHDSGEYEEVAKELQKCIDAITSSVPEEEEADEDAENSAEE